MAPLFTYRLRVTTGEESVTHNLRGLPPCSVVAGAERAVRVSTDYAPGGYTLYLRVEGMGGRHIREALPCDGFRVARGIGDYLGYLPPCGGVAGTERAVCVPAYDAT